jgi:hypothetical protein
VAANWRLDVWRGVASLSGLAYMLTTAIDMVRNGQGLETYRTFWLVEFNWLGFLIFLAAVVIALLVGLAFQIRDNLQWRALEKKYDSREDHS